MFSDDDLAKLWEEAQKRAEEQAYKMFPVKQPDLRQRTKRRLELRYFAEFVTPPTTR